MVAANASRPVLLVLSELVWVTEQSCLFVPCTGVSPRAGSFALKESRRMRGHTAWRDTERVTVTQQSPEEQCHCLGP